MHQLLYLVLCHMGDCGPQTPVVRDEGVLNTVQRTYASATIVLVLSMNGLYLRRLYCIDHPNSIWYGVSCLFLLALCRCLGSGVLTCLPVCQGANDRREDGYFFFSF